MIRPKQDIITKNKLKDQSQSSNKPLATIPLYKLFFTKSRIVSLSHKKTVIWWLHFVLNILTCYWILSDRIHTENAIKNSG